MLKIAYATIFLIYVFVYKFTIDVPHTLELS